MSRPWQFSEDGARSPFDRQAASPAGPPPSFKTNVNRNKTRKWTEAKAYTYDGDDWGGDYDPYNEYGSYDNNNDDDAELAAEAAPLPSASALKHRKNSFERGDEMRSFSAGFEPQTPQQHADSHPKPSSAPRAPQDGSSAKGPYDLRRDFTQPAHVPPPLRFGGSPAAAQPPAPTPQANTASPRAMAAAANLPPRKSSLTGSPLPGAMSTELPASPTPKSASGPAADKPLPFIRPSDIYKRMGEERERERRTSDSSSRPVADSLHGRQFSDDAGSPSRSSGRRPSLDPVDEGREPAQAVHSDPRHLPEVRTGFQGFTVDNPILANAIGASVASHSAGSVLSSPLTASTSARTENNLSADRGASDAASVSTTLPPVSRVASGFGSDFWGASELGDKLRAAEDSHDPATLTSGAGAELTPSQSEPKDKTLEHQPSLGFRSVVHQAFDRQDDSSVPPTPISRDNSQSQHSSDTSGISPIMSRVPSSANPESRARAAEARDAAVPPIAEESSQPTSPDLAHPPSHPPTHSRNTSGETSIASFTPGYRRSLDPPSQEGSPGRTPELEYTKRLSHPMVAETAHSEPVSTKQTDTDPVKSLPADYTSRESDIAEHASSPERSSFGVASAAQSARAQFLQAHSPTLANSPAFPKPTSRATSPIPGRQRSPGGASRVRELAGQYDQIQSLSRTNSSLSSHSKSSTQSWERSEEYLPLKKTSTFDSTKSGKDELSLPQYDNAASQRTPTRPDIQAAPSFRPHLPGEWVSFSSPAETANDADNVTETEATPRKAEFTETTLGSPDTPRQALRESEYVDLTPNTVKRKLHEKDLANKESSSSPVDAVKAAGDALGSALMASIGLGGGHETKDFAEPDKSIEAPSVAPEDTRRRSIGNIYLRPLAENRAPSSVGSSVAPTPPPKDTPKASNLETSSDYFPRPVVHVESDYYLTDNSPLDTESDRLRKEIERQLTPQPPHTPGALSQIARDQDALDGPANLREHQADSHIPVSVTPVPSVLVASAGATPETSSQSRPTFLGDRFSWEKRAESTEPLFATEDSEPRMPYERPRSSQALHIVNTNVESSSDSEPTSPVRAEAPQLTREEGSTPPPAELEAAPVGTINIQSPVSPITTPNVYPSIEGQSEDVSALSSPSMLPQHDSQLDTVLPESMAEPTSVGSPTIGGVARPSTDATRIPPFREILALKSTPERISKYNDTRTQFATMDTGLSSWLSTTLSTNPEHAHLASTKPELNLATSTTNGSMRRKVTGPSIMKIARNLGPSKDNPSIVTPTDTDSAASTGPIRQRSVSQTGAEKMQAKGKDFMKSAGMFGGKASVGAKGLFAKAKGRLNQGGGEKATSSSRPKNSRQISESSLPTSNLPSLPLQAETAAAAAAATSTTTATADEEIKTSGTSSSNTLTKVKTSRSAVSSHSTQHTARAPSRSSNRFSTAFNRLRERSESRSLSRPSSTVLPPIDTGSIPYSTDIKSPNTLTSPAAVVVSPWDIGHSGTNLATPDDQIISKNGRVGLLPSPAAERQMSLGHPSSEVDHERLDEAMSDVLAQDAMNRQDAFIRARLGKGTHDNDLKLPLETDISNPQPLVDDDLSSPKPASRIPTLDESQLYGSAAVPQETTFSVTTPENATLPLVSSIGSVLRSPEERPGRFSSVYSPGDTVTAPERSVSPVSSLGQDGDDEGETKVIEEGSALERIVSPIQETGMLMNTGSSQPMQSMFPVVTSEAVESPSGIQETHSLKERSSFSSQHRPENERRSNRSSLPSQQRAPLETRRVSYGAWGSRRTSQVLEPATEGVATPHFGSRRNSIECHPVYTESPVDEQVMPQAAQGSYFPPATQPATSAPSELSNGPYVDYAPTISTLATAASSNILQPDDPYSLVPVQSLPRNFSGPLPRRSITYDQDSALSRGQTQQYRHSQTPVTANAPPPLDPQQYAYSPPPVPANAPPVPSLENLNDQHFAPAVHDPRQQSAEFQLPGVGPPAGEPRRQSMFRGKGSDTNAQGSTANQNVLNRINPSAMMERQQTFTGDEFPTTTRDKQEKRKSSIFGAFSRSSSISDGWQSRLPSRGSTTGGASNISADKHQQSHGTTSAAVSAAQQARENAAKSNTLQKVQRSSTTASAARPEKKEKRFSRLGSIFGRRNSQAQPSEPRKGNRLVKAMPPSYASNARSTPKQSIRDNMSSSQQGGQRNLPSPPSSDTRAMYQNQRGMQSGQEGVPQLPAAWTAAPPGGWYAPSARPSSFTEEERQQFQQQQLPPQPQPTLPYVQSPGPHSPQPATRRLHSEGFRRDPRYMTASPGPGAANSTMGIAPASQEHYSAAGSQHAPPASGLPPQPANRPWEQGSWEQGNPPIVGQRRLSGSNLQEQQLRGPPQRPLSGTWQRQSSFGSDTIPYSESRFSHGTPPANRPVLNGRQISVGSVDRNLNLTPTHSRTASYGAAPRDAYRMSNPIEGEQMLQRDFENSLAQAQAHDPAYFTDRGAYPILSPPPADVSRELPVSANSSPLRNKTGASRFPPQQQQQQPQSNGQQAPFYPQQQRQYSNGQMAPPPQRGPSPGHGIARGTKTPSGSRTGSRRNSLNMIDEHHPFSDPSQPPPMPATIPQQGYSPSRTGAYWNSAERRRMERRESGGGGGGGVAGMYYGGEQMQPQMQPQTQARGVPPPNERYYGQGADLAAGHY